MKLETEFENTYQYAQLMDKKDPLSAYRERFLIPKQADGKPIIHLCGNSLGLQPKTARPYIEAELEDWAKMGIEGHLNARHPWLPYHENLTAMTARLVGALPKEVVVMNTLTVNLHLMLVSFYRPRKDKYKILIENNSFPSDHYAVRSQADFHGYKDKEAIVELKPPIGQITLSASSILEQIEEHAASTALILLGNVNYLSGQAFDMQAIAELAHKHDIMVGFNLAHGAGNLLLNLHDNQVDFAVWCSYKYLNAGPGAIAGCFVHERHGNLKDIPRFAGWWGTNKKERFKMLPDFDPISGAEGWQLSNPPIFQMAALRASMEIFDQAGMPALREKGDLLSGYLEFLLNNLADKKISIITPADKKQRGNQLSLSYQGDGEALISKLKDKGVYLDFREPNILRAAPAPLYNSFADVYNFVNILSSCL